MIRKITEIIVHCSATKPKVDIGVKELRRMHIEDNKWADIGYHYVVRLDGTVERGRQDYRQGAHCYGHNRHSIGVCYIGGVSQEGKNVDTRTAAQKESLRKLLKELSWKYKASIHGHNEFSHKDCPCFDAHKEYKDIDYSSYRR